MPSRRSVLLVLCVGAAVVAVVIGISAVTGSESRPVPGAGPSAPVAAAGGTSTPRWPPPPDAARDPQVAARQGVLVAQGAEVTVERVDLPAATTVDLGGEPREVSVVYRVTASAGPYVMRDQPAIIAADGTALGVAAESVDLSRLVLYTYDDGVSIPGVTLSLSYGLPGEAPIEWSTTLEEVP